MPGFPGVSFVPGQQQDQPQAPRTGGAGPQSAIQMLSLRLPRILGAQAMAPGALLQSRGGGGLPDPLLQAILRLAGLSSPDGGGFAGAPGGAGPGLMGGQMGGQMAPMMGPIGPPRIVPGQEPSPQPYVPTRAPGMPGNRGTTSPLAGIGPVDSRRFGGY